MYRILTINKESSNLLRTAVVQRRYTVRSHKTSNFNGKRKNLNFKIQEACIAPTFKNPILFSYEADRRVESGGQELEVNSFV